MTQTPEAVNTTDGDDLLPSRVLRASEELDLLADNLDRRRSLRTWKVGRYFLLVQDIRRFEDLT
jgi:hypothetical protein